MAEHQRLDRLAASRSPTSTAPAGTRLGGARNNPSQHGPFNDEMDCRGDDPPFDDMADDIDPENDDLPPDATEFWARAVDHSGFPGCPQVVRVSADSTSADLILPEYQIDRVGGNLSLTSSHCFVQLVYLADQSLRVHCHCSQRHPTAAFAAAASDVGTRPRTLLTLPCAYHLPLLPSHRGFPGIAFMSKLLKPTVQKYNSWC